MYNMKKQENTVGLENINFSFFHKVRQISTHADVGPIFKFRRNFNRSRCGWLCLSLEKIGFETVEARLAPGSTIQVYSDKATVQVYSNSTNS